MNRLVPVVAVLFAGCGLEPQESPGSSESSAQAQPVLAATAPPASPIERLVVPAELQHPAQLVRAGVSLAPRLSADISGLPGDGSLRAVAGMLGCGFSEIGGATVSFAGSVAHLDFPLSETGQFYSLLFFIDADGDGACTTEQVYSVDLPPLPTATVRIDASALTPTGYSCYVFR
ncbi:MAG: hypothetical protein IPJ65_27995 [Archangiaceae bacterium]|nr:hypothetical protein [Archangiaceae bacterium]